MYTLTPFFYDDFYCIGSECPYTCCGGWLIVVNKEAKGEYEKYDGLLGYDKEKDVYMLQFNGNHMCPLCDQDQLCKIHKAKGEKALCEICRTFPRNEVMTKGIRELYLSLGCPYVVSFFRGRKEPLSFILEENEMVGDEAARLSDQEKKIVDVIDKTIDVDMKIRDRILDLLQNREWPLWFREFMAAYCLDRIKEEHHLGKTEEMYAILEKTLDTGFMGMLMQQLIAVPKDWERRFHMLTQIAVGFEDTIADLTFFGKEGGHGTRAAELLNRNRNISFDEYRTAEEKWRVSEGAEFDLLMEHIASYQWMNYALLGYTKYYMMDNYWNVILEQILIRHFCLLHYSIYYDMEWDAIEFIIAFICRVVSHGRGTMKEKIRVWKEKGILSAAGLYFLM